MRKLVILYLILSVFMLFTLTLPNFCQSLNPEAIVKKRIFVKEIPAASGIEILNNKIYIIADNSPFLFELNNEFELIRKIKISSTKYLVNCCIPKAVKPDFESITSIEWGKDTDLLIFGSGSGENREKMVKVDFDKKKINTKDFDLEKFYTDLRDKADINFSSFNLEGAAVWNNNIILLNRGKNNLFLIDAHDFKKNIDDKKDKVKDIEVFDYSLPSIEGNNAGFSGCCLLENENMLVFTASIENTPDWINDGEILGSYIGLLDLKEPGNTNPVCVPVTENGIQIKSKIESVAVRNKTSEVLNLIVVTDNDNGKSEILLVNFTK